MSPEVHAPDGEPSGPRPSRDAMVLIFGRSLAMVSDALLPLVIVRLLGKAEVGVLGSVLLVYQTVALIVASGLPPTLTFQLSGRAPDERRAIAANMARGLFGFGLLASLLLLGSGALGAFAPDLAARVLSSTGSAAVQGAFGYMFLLAAFPLGDLPARMLPNLLVCEGRADAAARFAVGKSVGTVMFVLVPAALGMGIQAVLVSYGVFGVLQGLWLLRELRVLYAGTRKVPAPVTFGQTLRFALPLGATDIVGQLTQRFDRYLVAASFTALMFAEYHVGAFQIPILTTIAYSVGAAYAPTLTDLLRGGKAREAIGLWRGTIAKTSLLVVPLSFVVAIAAEGLIELLFTKNYSQAASVFRFYALATAGRVAAFGAVIVAAGKPRLLLRAAVATLTLQVVLSTLGLRLFGFVGPAVGACVAFVPMVAVYCYYIASATGLQVREIFPGTAYFKVVAVATVAALPALLFERRMQLHPGLEVLGVAVILLSLFVVLGRLSGVVSAADLAFVKERLRLQRKRG